MEEGRGEIDNNGEVKRDKCRIKQGKGGIYVILVKVEGGMWIRDWRKGWRRGRRGGDGRNSYLCFCLNIVLNIISTQCSNLR